MEKKYYYYNRFLGEVVEIAEWMYDESKKTVHYRLPNSNEWETDLSPVSEPAFCKSKTECMDLAKQVLIEELDAYEENQIDMMETLQTTLIKSYNELNVVSWKKVRKSLGEEKCTLLSKIIKWQDD